MDLKIRAISNKHNLRISIVDISETIKEITDLQQSNTLANMVFSKFVCCSTLIGMQFKNKEKTYVNWNAPKSLTKAMIAEYHDSKIRAYIQNKNVNIDNFNNKDLNEIICLIASNTGDLIVSRDLNLKEPYVSNIEIEYGNIDYDFMKYFNQSNQTKSFITTEVKFDDNLEIKKVVGILVEMLPNHTKEDLDYISEKLGNTSYVKDVLVKSTNYYAIVKEIDNDATILDQSTISFECTCSYQKVLSTLNLLNQNDLKDIIKDNKPVEVVCDFCNQKYQIQIQDVLTLLN
ncbi:Hsp33 family molecular chaperone HslO [Mycoplasma mycoides]|uniref:Hsp33 family molecular chaperone HslO n=1 Tax=Mycoplasma mycoides TaxID=2102 RepID=UPI00223F2665|nr:Hsp33 family molecular chaperone HslO [Mycoplasma mycoides]QVK02832.1 Hsp33 family molecular chaperone HslO [Mycoplasma mycoides subsp. capri]QVK03649.1 Hsp33 family molecular chaperone HslO [Mycoplasma mycoides subsp. capri]